MERQREIDVGAEKWRADILGAQNSALEEDAHVSKKHLEDLSVVIK